MAEDDEERRPGLTLFPEHGADLPVWHGPGGEGSGAVSAEELLALGVWVRLITGGVAGLTALFSLEAPESPVPSG
ncbi:hypothetical protein JKP75_02590 [Blastococcus sp. TML/M2B]|uniref:hypothetical protein n=1 Tax=unclassified Blastococcus TaxID=2619396 RepID=UPI00190D8C05|nr:MULTISPECIES: hypothetical protein [unclassified Blastococcus]MBN1091561.1 hypothetical protein [Blastococcus sp. TML/M2B]MBN1094888.1 hypothetical protein [Blastococcus sp. TML/C7B]